MHVAITGASSGIGEALARELSAAGADVTLIARREALLRKLASELPTKSHVVVKDLTQTQTCADWVPAAEAALGPIDVLINNAGIMRIVSTPAADPDAEEAALKLLLTVPMRLSRAVLPGMLARRSGALVDIASVAALVPTAHALWYSAAKAGHAAASELLHDELRGTGVHVLTVYPGPVHSALGDAALTAYQPSLSTRVLPWGDAAVLARRVRKALEKRKRRLIYPRFYALTRYFPLTSRFFMSAFSPKLKGG